MLDTQRNSCLYFLEYVYVYPYVVVSDPISIVVCHIWSTYLCCSQLKIEFYEHDRNFSTCFSTSLQSPAEGSYKTI